MYLQWVNFKICVLDLQGHAQEPVRQRDQAPIAAQADAGRVGAGPGGESRLHPRPPVLMMLIATYAFR